MFDSTNTELILATCILGMTIATQWRQLPSPQDMNFYDIALVSYSLFFAAGAWVGFFYGDWSFHEDAWVSREPPARLISAYWIVGSFIGVLWLGRWVLCAADRASPTLAAGGRRYSIAEYFRQGERLDWRPVMGLYLAVLTLRLSIAMKYGIFFSGTATAERALSVPYSIVILSHLGDIVALGCLAWTSLWAARRGWERVLSVSVLLVELVWAFTQGRRWVLAWFAIGSLGFFVSGRKVRLRQLLAFGVASVVVMGVVFPFFSSVRYAYYFKARGKDVSAVQSFARAAVSAAKGNSSLLYGFYKSNMATRPLFLRAFICDICEGLDRRGPMMGEALVDTLRTPIPSAVLPEKNSGLGTEQLIQSHFGLRLHDVASTWPAYGCADFGRWIGGVCAGAIVAFWILLMVCWCDAMRRSHPFLTLCLAAATINCLLQVEEDPSTCWVMTRDMVVLLVAALVLYLVQYLAVPVHCGGGSPRQQQRGSEAGHLPGYATR